MNCRAWLVAALVLFLPGAHAAESGYTLKPTELKDKPFLDAATVVTLAEKTQVEIATKGMMKQLRNDAELAGVLGHEVAHVTRKHHLKALRKAALVNLLSAGAAAATAERRHTELVQKLSGPTKELYARGLDKADEFEADRMGVVLSARAGYDPYGLPAALTTLASADPKSAVFYNRVKGEVEQAIAAVGLPAACFFRPSLLLRPRAESRPGEKISIAVGKLIGSFLIGGLHKYRPIHAETVAAAMVHVTNHDVPAGVIESDAIARLAALES